MNDARIIAYAMIRLQQEGYSNRKIVDSIWSWLSDAHKTRMAQSVIYEMERILKVIKKHNTLTIVSPFNLDHEIVQSLCAKVTDDRDVIIEFSLNRELLGGFLIKYKGIKIDATLKMQLQKAASALIN